MPTGLDQLKSRQQLSIAFNELVTSFGLIPLWASLDKARVTIARNLIVFALHD
jgi:hypothetical protein